MRRDLMALSMGLLWLSMAACAALVAGGAGAATAYTYVSGWLTRDYDATLEQAYQASVEAFQENDINVVERSQAIGSAEIKAETKDQTFWVDLASKGENLTEVSVRAGLLGDKPASEEIHRSIEANL